MCLGVPGQVIEMSATDGDQLPMAVVAFGGTTKPICVALVPNVRPGDYVLVHAGLALETIDEAHANELLNHLRAMSDSELADLTAGGLHEASR